MVKKKKIIIIKKTGGAIVIKCGLESTVFVSPLIRGVWIHTRNKLFHYLQRLPSPTHRPFFSIYFISHFTWKHVESQAVAGSDG